VTQAIKRLETRLGVRLLQRTTRQVSPTLDGEAYHRRCVAILSEVEDAEGAFLDARPTGLLRVDMHGTLARTFVLPDLPNFLARYPGLRIHLGEGDRWVDLVREGVDCVLRVGDLADSSMVGRRMACRRHRTISKVISPLVFSRRPREARFRWSSSTTARRAW
jgi:DNA-binding transcriptional LysR family regulator